MLLSIPRSTGKEKGGSLPKRRDKGQNYPTVQARHRPHYWGRSLTPSDWQTETLGKHSASNFQPQQGSSNTTHCISNMTSDLPRQVAFIGRTGFWPFGKWSVIPRLGFASKSNLPIPLKCVTTSYPHFHILNELWLHFRLLCSKIASDSFKSKAVAFKFF